MNMLIVETFLTIMVAAGVAVLGAMVAFAGAAMLRENTRAWRAKAAAAIRCRAKWEVAFLCVCACNLLHFAATKESRSHGSAGAGETAQPESVRDGTSEASLTFLSISASTNEVKLEVALPATLPGNAYDVFFTYDLMVPWALLGVSQVAAGESVATNTIVAADLPDSPAAMPAMAFFRLGDHSDADGDGIFDCRERFVHGTNPSRWDTDGDGLSDGDEIASGIDPLSRDTDGDGYPDDEEIASATNPLVANAGAAATIRYMYDDDDRLTAAYVGNVGGASLTEWTSTGDPATASERGRVSCGDDR